MIMVIDNYDSFTYNIVQYLRELGAMVNVARNDQVTMEDIEALKPTHLLISPGPCTPNEAGISLAAIQHFAGKIPILGVCLGHQS
ncbi:MAG: anthranilate synthase component II, partial [Tumebacillaceae bacterium]